MKLFVLVISVLMYALVIAFPHKKAYMSLGAAAAVLAAGAVSVSDALALYINWNVLLIYIGSLIIAELFVYSRVPAYIADKIVENSPSLGIGIVSILVMTGLLSAFVENVATVLVMAPIALEICRKLKISPVPFLVGLAVMANLQGTATLVGDPPSMIFASYAGYSFNDFFVYQGRPSIFFAVEIGGLIGAVYFWFYFRKLGKTKTDLPAEKIVSLLPSSLLIIMVAGLALISFFIEGFSILSGILCFSLGIVGLLWYLIVRREPWTETKKLIAGLDWETIAFLVGIFVVIGSIEKAGILDDLAGFFQGIVGDSTLLGFVVIVLASVLLSGFIDNVPYIIVMLPVAAELAQALGLRQELYMFALLTGSCLGGNLTPFGASANIVSIGILKKEGCKVRFMDWIRIALPFTALTTLGSALFIWFVWR